MPRRLTLSAKEIMMMPTPYPPCLPRLRRRHRVRMGANRHRRAVGVRRRLLSPALGPGGQGRGVGTDARRARHAHAAGGKSYRQGRRIRPRRRRRQDSHRCSARLQGALRRHRVQPGDGRAGAAERRACRRRRPRQDHHRRHLRAETSRKRRSSRCTCCPTSTTSSGPRSSR